MRTRNLRPLAAPVLTVLLAASPAAQEARDDGPGGAPFPFGTGTAAEGSEDLAAGLFGSIPTGSSATERPVLHFPLVFVENLGQFSQEILFQTRMPGGTAAILPDGWALQDPDSNAGMRLRFEGAGLSARPVGVGETPARVHYLDDGSRGIEDVRTYERAHVEDLLPGVDAEFYMAEGESGGRLEYDLRISPGVAVEDIVFTLVGVESSEIAANGELVVVANGREVRQQAPITWQLRPDGSRQMLPSAFARHGEHTYGFAVTGRDLSLGLLIDPILVYSEFVGGSNADEAADIAVDAAGFVYVAGWAKSSDFPMVEKRRRGKDGVVFKLDPTGTELLYATYFGGSHDDEALGIEVGSRGEVTVVGVTKSDDFPTTANAYRRERSGGSDGFALRLDSEGRYPVFGTYLGGSSDDRIAAVALGPDGSSYLTGATRSRDFPTSPHAVQSRHEGGRDAFAARLDSKGQVLVYSTYLGGIREDSGNAIALDDAGHAFVVGRTDSADFPVTLSVFDERKNDVDGFVTKLSSGGGTLVYSSFLGGSQHDEARSVAINETGSAYVCGWTQSADFPTSIDAFQAEKGGRRDGFLVRFSPSGSTLPYATYLGGEGNDEALAVALDTNDNPWLAGRTSSDDFPATIDAVQRERAGGDDAFLVGIDARTGELAFGTYMGGGGDDFANSVDVQHLTRNVVIAGAADDVAPEERGPFAGQKRGPSDAWVARFEPGLCGGAAELTVLGTGCGADLLAHEPRLGRTFELSVVNAPPGAPGAIWVSGASDSTTLLQDLCEVHLDPATTRVLVRFETDEEGRFDWSALLPRDAAQCGRTLTLQAGVFADELGPLSFGQLTGGVMLTIGD